MKIKIDKADTLFSQYIRTRDNWTCQRCFKKYEPPTSGLQCSHFVGRRNENTRFDPDNCDALCFSCHQYFTANPLEHYEWQVSKKGIKKVKQLRFKSNLYKKKDRKLEAIYWAKKLKEIK